MYECFDKLRLYNVLFLFFVQGIGEPPLFLAASVFFAIKEAVKSARAERGITGPFQFWSPATVERIRLACCDKFVEMVRICYILTMELQLAVLYLILSLLVS